MQESIEEKIKKWGETKSLPLAYEICEELLLRQEEKENGED